MPTKTIVNVSTGEETSVEVLPAVKENTVEYFEQGSELPEGFVWATESEVQDIRNQKLASVAFSRLQSDIQIHLDTHAQTWGYDDIRSAVTYAEEPSVEQFQLEGQALRAWRSQVWAAGYAILSDVRAGTRPIPTKEELLSELPPAPVKPIVT